MDLPFTKNQFLDIFRDYNYSVFPTQILLYISAIVLLYLIIKPNKYSTKIIILTLAAYWAWMGIVYHYIFFSNINPAAKIFAALFLLESVLLIYAAMKKDTTFKLNSGAASITGGIMILYALIIYPLLGYYFGHGYPDSPTFGLPCPTTIFTLGILILSVKRVPVLIIIIPLIWSAIGFTASQKLGITEDIGLGISGLLFLTFYFIKKRSEKELPKPI